MADNTQLQKQVRAAKKFLASQIIKQRKMLTIRLIVGGLISVIVLAYMIWLSNIIVSSAKPEKVRSWIVNIVRSELPQLTEETKRQIKANKRTIIKFITEQGLENLSRLLVRQGEEAFHRLLARIINETVDGMNQRFVKVLKDKNSKLRKRLEKVQTSDASIAPENLVKDYDDDLQREMGQMNFDEDFHEPLSVKYKKSLEQLRQLNLKLQELARKKVLTRQESLMVRFIKSWNSYVQSAAEENTGEDRCSDGSTPKRYPPPRCTGGKILAVQNGEFVCVDPATCKP